MCVNLLYLYMIMKKTALFVALQLSVMSAFAVTVDRSDAQKAAERFIESRSHRDLMVSTTQTVGDGMYIVNFAPQGWVIVSADDVVKPIIGYSLNGSLDRNRVPENMSYMLDSYQVQINRIVSTNSTRIKAWDNPVHAESRAGNAVEPLIKVRWNQPAPFNAYCPRKTALVGCVAVAMSQAMSVQQYPARPKGSVSYTRANYGRLSNNFDEQRAYNWGEIMSGANNYDEAARLMYHAGMSVKMDYGEDGSGIPSSQVSLISNALKDNFGYSDDVTYYWRDEYRGDWRQLLTNELNAGRAIVYNAIDSKGGYGHSFNVDGYDENGLFNINWGWGGYGNGYFSIDNLRDGQMNMNYDSYHVAVVGIGAPDRPLKSISLSHTSIEENLPAGSVVGSIMVNGDEPKSSYTVSVHGVYQSSLGGYEEVPFVYENGMLKTTRALTTSQGVWNVEITVVDSETNTELTQGFKIRVEAWASLEKKTQLQYDRASGMFVLKTKHNVTYKITDANGALIQSGAMEPLPELQFNKSILSPGTNTLELRCNSEVKTIKIVTK